MKSFGELIANRRKALGLTQTELALRIVGKHGGALSQERIADIESNRYGVPRLPILEQLARELQARTGRAVPVGAADPGRYRSGGGAGSGD